MSEEIALCKARGEQWDNRVADPRCQSFVDDLGPALFLTAIRWKAIVAVRRQVRCNGADIVCEIHVLGETRNGSIDFRQGRATLENEMFGEGRAVECLEAPNNPHILFQQMYRAARSGCGDVQRVASVSCAE